MSYVDAAINRLKDEAERKAATPLTPDAGVSESVRALQRIRETCADVDAWQVWSADGALLEAYPGELLDHIATLTAQLAAAKADAANLREKLTAMSDEIHDKSMRKIASAQSAIANMADTARTGAR